MATRISETPDMMTVNGMNLRSYIPLKEREFFDIVESKASVGCGLIDLYNHNPNKYLSYLNFNSMGQSRIFIVFKTKGVCYQATPEEMALVFDGSGETRNLIDQLEFFLNELKLKTGSDNK
jgi:hypothetical protein